MLLLMLLKHDYQKFHYIAHCYLESFWVNYSTNNNNKDNNLRDVKLHHIVHQVEKIFLTTLFTFVIQTA